jgi:hypothetical protein
MFRDQTATAETIATKPLNADVFIDIQNVDLRYIHVGNTGLTVSAWKTNGIWDWQQHFTPEKNIKPIPGKEHMYSLIYPYAVWNFLSWWKDDRNFSEDFPKLCNLTGETNARMHRLRKNIFGGDTDNGIYSETGYFPIGPSYTYRLDLEKLSANQDVCGRLQKLADECRKKDYQIVSPTPEVG